MDGCSWIRLSSLGFFHLLLMLGWRWFRPEADLRPGSEGGTWDLGFLGSLQSQIRQRIFLKSQIRPWEDLGLVSKLQVASYAAAESSPSGNHFEMEKSKQKQDKSK